MIMSRDPELTRCKHENYIHFFGTVQPAMNGRKQQTKGEVRNITKYLDTVCKNVS